MNNYYFLYPSKSLPIFSYKSETKQNVIIDSNFCALIGRQGQASYIVDKQYVDGLTGLVTDKV